MFSSSIKCLNNTREDNDEKNILKFKFTIYGLLLTVLALIIEIIIETILHIKKHSLNKKL